MPQRRPSLAWRAAREKVVPEARRNFPLLVDLLLQYKLEAPTHLKIDVDGLEPWIIQGGEKLLESQRLRTILIELNRKSKRDMAIPDLLAKKGFRLSSERSNWESREDRTKKELMPATNMIYSR